MMNIFASIQRLKELYAYRHEPENLRPLSEFVWRTQLVLLVIGAVVVLIFAGNVFWGVLETLGSAAAGPARQPTVLDRAALQNTLHLIEERSIEFESKKTAPTLVVDPSR